MSLGKLFVSLFVVCVIAIGAMALVSEYNAAVTYVNGDMSGVRDASLYFSDAGYESTYVNDMLTDKFIISVAETDGMLANWLSIGINRSIFYGVETDMSHALSKHADDGDLYKKCIEDGGGNPVMGFINPSTNHCVEVFETTVEEGGHAVKRWLVRVVKQVDGVYKELTAFSEEWEYIHEVEQYLVNGGYMYMWP